MTDESHGADSFVGIDVFALAWEENLSSAPHAAIFMNLLRLYTHVAWVTGKPLTEFQANACLSKTVEDPANDPRIWSGSSGLIFGAAVDYCHGNNTERTVDRWLSIWDRSERWLGQKTKEFAPRQDFQPDEGYPFGRTIFNDVMHGTSGQCICSSLC